MCVGGGQCVGVGRCVWVWWVLVCVCVCVWVCVYGCGCALVHAQPHDPLFNQTSPGHSLREIGAKLVEDNRHPHVLVHGVAVAVAQKHDLR